VKFHGAGERSLFMAEEFAFQEAFRDRRAIEPDVTRVAPRAGGVQRAGDQFLAGAAFAEDEHRGGGAGHGLNQLPQLPDRRALADDPREVMDFARLGAQRGVLPQQTIPLGAPGDRVQQFLRLERLGEVIDGPGADGLHGQPGRGVGGDDQHRQIGPFLPQAGEKFVAGHAPQVGIGDHHEEALVLNQAQPAFRAFDAARGIALVPQHRFQ
jgi:hypothetical protein